MVLLMSPEESSVKKEQRQRCHLPLNPGVDTSVFSPLWVLDQKCCSRPPLILRLWMVFSERLREELAGSAPFQSGSQRSAAPPGEIPTEPMRMGGDAPNPQVPAGEKARGSHVSKGR